MPFGKKKIENTVKTQNPQKNISPNERIQLSQLSKKYKTTRRKLLLWIIICLAILIGLIVFAAFRAGGIQNLISGDKDIVTNTINNVGASVNSQITPTQTLTPTPLAFEGITPINRDQQTVLQNINSITITSDNANANIKIKKNTTLIITNATGKELGLQFSNGQQYRFEVGSKQAITFERPGVFTYQDVVNSYLKSVKGTVTVVE